MNPPLLPEEQARVLIDEQLNRAGWYVCDRKDIDLVNHRGNAAASIRPNFILPLRELGLLE
jgi:hypothetical protein